MTKYDETSTTNDSRPFNTFRKSRIKRTTDAGKVATILKCNTVDIKVAEIFALAQPDAIWLCMEHGSLDYNQAENQSNAAKIYDCLLYTSPSPRDATLSRMPSSA
mgnify:CR=1 FL=1